MAPTRRGILSVSAAGLALLGGCSAVPGAGGEESTPTPDQQNGDGGSSGGDGGGSTSTPTPTPTATPTATPEPTPDPRVDIRTPRYPKDFPITEETKIPDDGFLAYRIEVPEQRMHLKYTFDATNDEDFDQFVFDTGAFNGYRSIALDSDGDEVIPVSVNGHERQNTDGYVRRLVAPVPPGELYVVLDNTALGRAQHIRQVLGAVELEVFLDLVADQG